MPNIAIALGEELNENTAPGSRPLRIGEVLKKKGFNVKFFSLDSPRDSYFWTYLYSNYSLAKEIAIYASDNKTQVISRGIYLNIFLALFSFRYNFQFAVEFHCRHESNLEWIFQRKYLHVLLFGSLSIFSTLRSNFIIGITPAICSYNERKFGKKTFLIPNGIETKMIKDIIDPYYKSEVLENNVKYIFFIGHQEPWTPLEDLLNLSEVTKSVSVVIIGESPRYKQYSIKYPNVVFLGKLDYKATMNLANNYAFCFYHPYLENEIWKYKSSRKLLEYMFFGKPIIINTKHYLDLDLEALGSFYDYPSGEIEPFLELLNSIISANKKPIENNLELYSWDSLISKSGLLDFINHSNALYPQ